MSKPVRFFGDDTPGSAPGVTLAQLRVARVGELEVHRPLPEDMGIWVGADAPPATCTRAEWLDAPDAGYWARLVEVSQATGLIAAGNDAATALDLEGAGAAGGGVFATVAASTGAKLAPADSTFGRLVTYVNGGANTVTMYPPTGGTIDDGASATIAAGKAKTFWCPYGAANTYYTVAAT